MQDKEPKEIKFRNAEEKYFYYCFFKGIRNLNIIVSAIPTALLSSDLKKLLDLINNYFFIYSHFPGVIVPPLDIYLLGRFPEHLINDLIFVIVTTIPMLTSIILKPKSIKRNFRFVDSARKQDLELAGINSINFGNLDKSNLLLLIARVGETYLFMDDNLAKTKQVIKRIFTSEQ